MQWNCYHFLSSIHPTCISNQETSTEAQGFPLRDVFFARARTPPTEFYNINKRKVALSVISHCPKSDKQLSHPAIILQPNTQWADFISSKKFNRASHLLSNDAFQINMPPLRKWDMMKLITSVNFSHLRWRPFNRWLIIKMLTQLYRRPAGAGYAFLYSGPFI